jgi:hypothetical protein
MKKQEDRSQKTEVRMLQATSTIRGQVLPALYIAGKPGEDIPTGTLNKILKDSELEKQ